MQFESWIAFCSIALLATATPGPAALLVSMHSLSFGVNKSLATVVGNVTGLFVMSGFSVLGLSAVVLHSAVAFIFVKVLGAMYLIYIGIKLWRNGVETIDVGETKSAKNSVFSLYTQGVIVALTNPKAIVFTTALFPQFIDVSDTLLPQFLILVFSFMSLSFICLCTYSLMVQRTKAKVKSAASGKRLGKVLGSTFIGAGCFLATASR